VAASTKVNLGRANRQSNNRVRAAHTLRVYFEALCDSQVGCVAKPRMRVGMQATACLFSFI